MGICRPSRFFMASFQGFVTGAASTRVDYYPQQEGVMDLNTNEVTFSGPDETLNLPVMVTWNQEEPTGSDSQVDKMMAVFLIPPDALGYRPSVGDRIEYPSAATRTGNNYRNLIVYQVDVMAQDGTDFGYGVRAKE